MEENKGGHLYGSEVENTLNRHKMQTTIKKDAFGSLKDVRETHKPFMYGRDFPILQSNELVHRLYS